MGKAILDHVLNEIIPALFGKVQQLYNVVLIESVTVVTVHIVGLQCTYSSASHNICLCDVAFATAGTMRTSRANALPRRWLLNRDSNTPP